MARTTLLASLICLAAACGYPTATHCDGTGFGKGVDSVLPIDCGVVYQNFEHGIQVLSRYATHVDANVYRHRMQHVHVEVRSLDIWNEGSTTVTGRTTVDVWSGHINIEISRNGDALLHETLHAYSIVSYFDDVGSVLALPVEGTYDSNHAGWLQHCFSSDMPGEVDPNDPSCGYYDADHQYANDCVDEGLGLRQTGCETLQPISSGLNIYR